jgi:hypothetical protein
MGWWMYVNAEKYNVFTVDQMYALVTAYVLRKDAAMLVFAAQLTKCDDKAWTALMYGNFGAFGAINDVIKKWRGNAAQVRAAESTGSETPKPTTPLIKTAFDKLMGALPGVPKSELPDMIFRYITGIFSVRASKLTISSRAAGILLDAAKEYEASGMMPHMEASVKWAADAAFSFYVYRRFPVHINIPNGLELTARLRSAGGTAADVLFSKALSLSTTGFGLNLNSIGIDKSDSAKTDYDLEGSLTVAGFPVVNLGTILGAVSVPSGPLPSGNEVKALLGMVEAAIDPQAALESLGSTVFAKLSLNGEPLEVAFEKDEIVVN